MMKLDISQAVPIICYRLTRNCNIHCNFCFASEHCVELSTNDVKYSIRRLKDFGMQEIRIGGGEPTLRSDLVEILRYCLDLNLRVRISSNLYAIDEIFSDIRHLPIGITTSLHGTPEYHNYVTGVNDSYEQTVFNITRLINSGMDVRVHSTLTKDSFTYAEELIQNVILLGVKKISFQTYIPRERGLNLRHINPPEELKQKLQQIQSIGARYQSKIKVKIIDLYQKFYYVFEPDGYLYLQQELPENDVKIERII